MASARHPLVVFFLILFWIVGSWRAFALWSHEPLYAYANSYDQTRYTSCFDFFPDRPAQIPPQENSPQAPFEHYRFARPDQPMCYWSSELLFGGLTALAWKLGELVGLGEQHSVRWVGALRWLALLALSIALSRAWLSRNAARGALANASLVPLVFADPGNTLYLNTFYAEWSALLFAYATCALTMVWRDAPGDRRRFGVLALFAFLLATSKIQHLLLPLVLAGVVLALDRVRLGRYAWRGIALATGAALGLLLQTVQLGRSGPMMDAIDQYNRADVVFTALLPASDDPAAMLRELGIDPACAIYSGHHAWEFPDLPERICTGLSEFSRGDELLTLARHPLLALRIAARGVLGLEPWIAKNLGQVEGGDFAAMSPPQPSVGQLLQAHRALLLLLLCAPIFALITLLRRPGPREGSRALDMAALVSVMMVATLAIVVLGDGLADVAKQGHLVVNAALMFVFVALVSRLTRLRD